MSGFLTGRTSLTSVQTADIADNAITLDKLAHQADGSILTFGTDTAPALLAPDTSGQVLTTKGAGALPSFDAAASPALSFVSTQVASDSASIAFTGIDNSSDTWMVQMEGCRMATESYYMQIHTSNDTSSHSYDTGASDYGTAMIGAYYDTAYAKFDNEDDSILMGIDPYAGGSDATTGMSARVHIHAPANTDFHTLISWEWSLQQTSPAPYAMRTFGIGKRSAAEAVTAIKFSMVSGNLAEGRFSLYKLAHS